MRRWTQFDAEFLESAVSNDYLPYIRVYSQKQIVKSASFVDPQTYVHFKRRLRYKYSDQLCAHSVLWL